MTFSIPALFGAGTLTFASPCILPIVPVYLSLLAGSSLAEVREGRGRGRLVARTVAFALGLSLVFVMLGMAASQAGRMLADHRVLLTRVAGVAIVLAGLRFLGLMRLPWLEREFRPGLEAVAKPAGLVGAFLFGAAFALGWTPCIGPVLGAVLTFTASRTASPLLGAGYLATYAAGLVMPLVITSLFAPSLLAKLRAAQRRVRTVEVITGVAMILVGGLLFSQRLSSLLPSRPHAAQAPIAASAHTPRPSAPCEAEATGAAACGIGTADTSHTNAPVRLPQHGPVMVEFVSSGCTICRRMAPIVERVSQQCAAHVPVVRVDVGSDDGRQLAESYRVLGVPTFVSIDPRGDEVDRRIGVQTERDLTGVLEQLAGRSCVEGS